jgi:Na+-transporting methylmalonyl-CoA/oxaloacetate decarboxylase gamma subunit
MKKRFQTEAGIVAIELILLLILVVVVGFVGYKVLHASATVEDSNANIDSSQPVLKEKKASRVQPAVQAPEVKSTSDLDKADKAVDQVNPDASNADSAQLNQQLSF